MKTYKLETQKVDTLKHISDHGLSVEFTDKKRKELLEAIKAIEFGKIIISAKNSDLILWKNGKALFAKTKFARHADAIACEYTSLSANKNPLGELSVFYGKAKLYAAFNSLSWKVLKRITMHESVNDTLNFAWGVTFDKWFTLLKTDAWILLGQTGLNAYSLSVERKEIEEKKQSLENQIDFAQSKLKEFSQSNQERLVKEAEELLEKKRAETREIERSYEEKRAIVRESNDIEEIRRQSGLWSIQSCDTKEGGKRWKMEGEKQRWTHELTSENYKAKIEGERIVLSSGIVCDIKPESVLAWLKGEASAPATRYGALKRIDGRNSLNEPVSLIACGCHRISVTELGEDWKRAMQPKHEPKLLEGTPSVFWDENPEAIREKAMQRLSESETESRNRCAQLLNLLRTDLERAKAFADPESLREKRAQLSEQLKALESELEVKKAELDELGPINPLAECRSTATAITKAFHLSL